MEFALGEMPTYRYLLSAIRGKWNEIQLYIVGNIIPKKREERSFMQRTCWVNRRPRLHRAPNIELRLNKQQFPVKGPVCRPVCRLVSTCLLRSGLFPVSLAVQLHRNVEIDWIFDVFLVTRLVFLFLLLSSNGKSDENCKATCISSYF